MSTEAALDRESDARIAVIVLTGVSGSGKSTIGSALSETLGWPYSEADDFHPQANIDKMSKGIPLTDEDRAPWLAKLAAFIADICTRGQHAIVSCSALKRTYRMTLAGSWKDQVRFVLLDGTEDEIAARLAKRTGHFMPPSLLHSQFATLERPAPDEDSLVVPIGGSKDAIVAQIVDDLRRSHVTVMAKPSV